ncbi:MAG: GntR family transcriptional regulator [Burkholderiaceae bacterium]
MRREETLHVSRTLPEQIADVLADDILSGRMVAGERIAEQAVADRFGVSRGPVRDAIKLIERAGLVINRPRVSARVLPVTLETLRERQEARTCLLALGAEYAAAKAGAEEIAQMRALLADVRAVADAPMTDYVTFNQHSLVLYEKLMAMAGSRQLSWLVNQVWGGPVLQMHLYRQGNTMLPRDWALRLLECWAKAIDAIEAGDAEAARVAIVQTGVIAWERLGAAGLGNAASTTPGPG